MKPIVKWAGGKRQLINELKANMPKRYNRYIEPFVGGGALFFELSVKNAIINDYNKELINLYEVVRDNPKELIDDISKHKNEEEYYYKIRGIDRDKEKFNKLTKVEKASRFLYLNKTGFNGLYRVNSKGECNVPFGKYKNPIYCEPENIYACSALLKDTTILNGDFEIVKEYIKKEDFIYFDPPYVPLNTTSNFTAYTDRGFDDDMQFRLKEFCDYINNKGAYFMLSNSYTDFTLELYKDYKINIIKAKRSINSNGNNRGKIKEILVTNY